MIPPRTSTARWIELDGAVNVRDLGGLPTSDGARIRPGRLLRSDNLQDLSPADVERLVGDQRLRLVLDLRTEVEIRLEGPAPLQARPEVRHQTHSLLPAAGRTDLDVEDVLPWVASDKHAMDRRHRRGPEGVSRVYRQYLVDRPDSITAALSGIADLADGAALVHCAAGKDRTGVVVALALAVAGVPEAEIVSDYALTGEVLQPLVARLLASPTYAEDIGSRPADSHRPLAASMHAFLTGLAEEWGDAAGWLTAHGFGPDRQAILRDRLRD